MYQYLKFILPVYIILYFVVLLVVPAMVVGKKIGKSPIVLSASDDAHGLIARYFLVWVVLASVYIILFVACPACYVYFMPMSYLENNTLTICGLAIMVVSLIWTSAAQINMQASWRVGIDEKQKTELVKTGIFRFSRNPIYLGMIVSVLGLFLVTPNAFTLLLVVLGYVLIQIQVRLEEEFLYKMHGQAYLDYKNSVRRFI
jgi:protein-S-isoprenylcysteine O-methyltransferase Ste14